MRGRRRFSSSRGGGTSRQFREQYVGGTLAALAAGAQATLFDHQIDNIINAGVSVGMSISTVAWKMKLVVDTAATGALHPIIHMFVLPQGTAVPSVLSSDLISFAAPYHWMSLFPSFETVSATGVRCHYTAVPRSTRRFNHGDRLVAVIINGNGAAFGATAAWSGHWEMLYRPGV